MAINFQNDVPLKLYGKMNLKKWISRTVLKEKKVVGEISFLFTSDEKLLKHNIRFLKHDTFTDIITFDYSVSGVVSGDVMISVQRVADNASRFKVDFNNELRRVMIHGVLHLCGYGDKTTGQRQVMRRKEDTALRDFLKGKGSIK
jgi:rRNA maturation RNase YbeY